MNTPPGANSGRKVVFDPLAIHAETEENPWTDNFRQYTIFLVINFPFFPQYTVHNREWHRFTVYTSHIAHYTGLVDSDMFYQWPVAGVASCFPFYPYKPIMETWAAGTVYSI